jgi:FkbM family methyltransferase
MFNYSYDTSDTSGQGCIREIIDRDDYKLYKYVNMDGTFIDIGGNHGIVTCILALQNPNAKIYTLEPIPKLVNIIQNNVDINNIDNVTIINKALGDGKNVKLTIGNAFSGCSSTIVTNTNAFSNLFSGFSQIDVKSITFDELLKEYCINDINLLKIDCEGGEYFLYDSIEFKKNIVKNIVGEFHNLKYNLAMDTNWNYNDLTKYVKTYVGGDVNISYLDL